MRFATLNRICCALECNVGDILQCDGELRQSMKSKTKTILIFLLRSSRRSFSLPFSTAARCSPPRTRRKEGTLIGAFVSEEDLDIGGDLAVSAAGKFVWKAGRLYMETDEDWFALGERGGGIYCTMEPDARYGEGGRQVAEYQDLRRTRCAAGEGRYRR